jgi:hypothetical protein
MRCDISGHAPESPQPSHAPRWIGRTANQEQLRDFDVFLSVDHAANSSEVFPNGK